ncbi:protein of unknown function [Candidatus Nitrosotalea okcheonensis]|uniref:Uncharacterized protein n=1 Tax=Candidatus Nitrosotalea okcheonensis TaxID=1903276 RepID=A0A2H1FF74_9ARCH|nr:protein of unknown function [Candidatus Nitrosotalea okcheonensis]
MSHFAKHILLLVHGKHMILHHHTRDKILSHANSFSDALSLNLKHQGIFCIADS